MPTTPITTWSGDILTPWKNPDAARLDPVNLKPSTTYAKGTVIGEITATPGVYGPYASGNSDGTQNPTHVLQYPCVTDAAGNVYVGTAAASEWGQFSKTAPAFRTGTFLTADLVGLDANAVTKLGRLVQGTVADGVLMMSGH